jgi:hypothetical protein
MPVPNISNGGNIPAQGNPEAQGNPHAVSVEQCGEMRDNGPISAEEYAQLSPDEKAVYQRNEDGTYEVTDDVLDITREHGV